MKITIGGLPGSGKTTAAKILSEKLSIKLISAGEAFRKIAREKSLSLEELGELASKDEKLDLWIDEFQKKEASSCKDAVVEGRLSAWMVDAELKVWLKAPLPVRAKRIASRDGISQEDARKHIIERERCEKERYIKYYKIDLDDLSIYDLVIDSSRWGPEDIGRIILSAMKNLGNRS